MSAILKVMLGKNSLGRRTKAIRPSRIIATIKILAVTGLLTEVLAKFIRITYCTSREMKSTRK